ncbi:unnamed protein product, partial [Polarella glacialis]
MSGGSAMSGDDMPTSLAAIAAAGAQCLELPIGAENRCADMLQGPVTPHSTMRAAAAPQSPTLRTQYVHQPLYSPTHRSAACSPMSSPSSSRGGYTSVHGPTFSPGVTQPMSPGVVRTSPAPSPYRGTFASPLASPAASRS